MPHLSKGRSRPGTWWRVLAVVAVAALVAAACGDDDTADEATNDTTSTEETTATDDGDAATTSTTAAAEDEAPVVGGSITVVLEAETNSWLPGTGSIANSGTVVASAFYDLLAVRAADGEVVPYLAESLTPNDDLTEWTVVLPEGVTFHDGTPLTAENQKRAFDEVLKAEGSNLLGALANVESVRVDDELTYTYVLSVTDASFPDVLTGTSGRPFSMTAYDADPEGFGDAPVGTGPFIFQSWTRDDRLVVTRNPDYWRTDDQGNQLPYLDEVVFRPIPDEDSRLQTVRAGDAQIGQTLRQSMIRQTRAAVDAGEIQSHESIGNNGGGSIINVLQAPVDDVRVRLGLAYALDQEALIEILGGTDITPAQTQYYSPDSPWFSEAVDAAFPAYDPERAAELIQEYVDDPDRSDGRAPGEPITVEFNCPPDPSLIELAQAYQAYWGQAGVDVTLNQVEQAAHIANAIGSPDTDPPFAGSYMVNCWRNGSQADPYTVLSQAYGPVATAPGNVTNYTSERLDANLVTLRESADFDTRYAANEDIMLELAEQVPVLWTGGTATAVFAVPEVRGLTTWSTPDGVLGTGVLGASFSFGQVWWAE
ncbi:MAG TPA: ABC transporter substrate-binding protein [Acidimicrobiales bacterium]|nr:ABC transporter substrate-binding protein [Acidimicrobiales bacterium]